MRIAIIENMLDHSPGLARLLHFYGHTVAAYGIDEHLTEWMSHFSPDVAIIDQRKIAPRGVAAARQIRTCQNLQNLSVVVVASFIDDDARHELARLGVQRCFIKPIDIDQFLDTIDQIEQSLSMVE